MSTRQSYKGWAEGSDGFYHYFVKGSSAPICDAEFVIEDGINRKRSVAQGNTPCPNCLKYLGLEADDVMYVHKPHKKEVVVVEEPTPDPLAE